MSNKTITLEGSEVKVEFYGTNAWLRNDGTSTIYAGKQPGVVSGADGVVSVPAGGSAPVYDAHGTVYLIGTGSVQLIGSDYSENPFKSSAQGGSGADDVARAAIEAHAANSAIHLTEEQLNTAVSEATEGGKTAEKAAAYTLDNAVDYPLVDMRVYGKSTQDGEPSPENPVEIVSVESPTVTACGKNLLNNTGKSVEKGGLSFTINNDGTIKVTGTPTAQVNVIVNSAQPLIVGEKYILSGCPEGGGEGKYRLSLRFGKTGAYKYFFDTGNGVEFTALESAIFVYFEVFANVPVDFIVYPMIRFASITDDTYEPYKGSIASLTSALPLCGIPVTEDGNYTDSNGQQWICDELIYNADGTGKIVKRTAKIDSYNGETVAEPYLSTMGSLTTGATVVYQLETPQEIQLTAEEMSQLQSLQTFDGVTNISNDSGAEMQIKYCTNSALSEYVKPIKTGLQKQIDELKSAVLSLGGNV